MSKSKIIKKIAKSRKLPVRDLKVKKVKRTDGRGIPTPRSWSSMHWFDECWPVPSVEAQRVAYNILMDRKVEAAMLYRPLKRIEAYRPAVLTFAQQALHNIVNGSLPLHKQIVHLAELVAHHREIIVDPVCWEFLKQPKVKTAVKNYVMFQAACFDGRELVVKEK